jgi:hypothetical protein
VVTAEIAVDGVAERLVLTVFCEPDAHAFNQNTKKAITTTRPSATVFHQSRGCLVPITVFIVLLLFPSIKGPYL